MNRVIVGIIIYALTFSSYAGSVEDELKSLGASFTSNNFSSSDPGGFVSKSRAGFSGGNIRKRVPRTVVNPISITAPKLTTGGCGGIDFHFGAFSFINGDQIRQLLSSYLQGVVGLAFTMAIDTACPDCGSAMNKMAEMANFANGLSLDSCAMAKGTMDAIFDEKQEACASGSVDQGSNDDRSQSKTAGGTCGSDKTPTQIVDEVTAQLDCSGLADDELDKCQQNKTKLLKLWGNSTVHILKLLGKLSKEEGAGTGWEPEDFWKAEIYQSTLGSAVDGTWYSPTLSPLEVFEAALCGYAPLPTPTAPADGNENIVGIEAEMAKACTTWLDKVKDDSVVVVTCDTALCVEGDMLGFAEWAEKYAGAVGEGFPFTSKGLLRTISGTIKSMEAKAKAGTSGFSPYEMYLLNSAPFPLYRLLNISSFYPNAASEILGENTRFLAVEFAGGLVEDLFNNVLGSRAVAAPKPEGGKVGAPKDMITGIQATAKEFIIFPSHYTSKDNMSHKMNTKVVQQILSLEKSLLQSNLNKGLSGLGL
jgi:hypothetical protein